MPRYLLEMQYLHGAELPGQALWQQQEHRQALTLEEACLLVGAAAGRHPLTTQPHRQPKHVWVLRCREHINGKVHIVNQHWRDLMKNEL